MTERRFVILYDLPTETKLEEQLKTILGKHGWELYSVGDDSYTNERDLSFYKNDGDDEC